MSYTEITRKKRRIVERDVETLFSPRAFLRAPTLDELKRLVPFHPSVKYKNGTLFLSEKGVAALRRLTNSLSYVPELANAVSVRDIDTQVQKSYGAWLEKNIQPTGEEFIDEVVNSLLGQVKHYEFLVQIEGIDLKDMNILSLGSFRIQRSDPSIFENVRFGGNLDREAIYSQFKDSLWLIGSAKGSSDVASEQFDYRAVLTVGILGICGAVLYNGAIWRSRVRAVTSPLEHRKAVSSLRWEAGGENPSLSWKWGAEQDLALNAESVAYLTEVCFLEQLSNLPDRQSKSELEDAIIRSIYWFAEAYRDRNPIMQFVKLWTCAECFFAIDREQITELNAKGIATILAFAGFKIVETEDYTEFKRRVKLLYGLRSKAIHRAEFGHVEKTDLDELSHWVAWVVISMIALAERGYQTLRQVHEQTQRLDRLSSGRKKCAESS